MTFFGPDLRNGLPIGLGSVAGFGIAPRFSPSSLFAGGVQGAWYDPSDLTTLFQDSAGTTPVTAVEQPVGLMLDKSKGLVLGADVVTNGNFATDSNWNKGTGWAISGGAAVATATSDPIFQGPGTGTGVGTTVGKFYVATWDQVVTSGSTRFRSNTYSGNYASSGRQVYYFTADSQNIHIYGNSFTGTIDNLVVRELPGNHAYQTTSASRPTLRARYNLLTRSEEFNDAVWTKSNVTVTANAAVAPDGTTTADLMYPTSSGTFRWVYQTVTLASAIYTRSIYAKAQNKSIIYIDPIGTGVAFAYFNLSNGTVGTVSAGYTATITAVGNGWYRCTMTNTVAGATSFGGVYGVADADGSTSVTANGTDGIFVWGAQLTATAVFPSNTYQRVGAATDYATGAAFPPYLFCDGIDDSMLTNSVDFATVTSDGQARRNLLNNPTQFDTASWTKDSCTISANATTAPDGTITADKVVSAAATAATGVGQSIGTNSGQFTQSWFVKQAEVRYVQLLWSGGASAEYANFDLQTGVVTQTTAAVTPTISAAANGFYRITLTSTLASATVIAYCWAIGSGTAGRAGTYAGNGVDGFFIWGAQLETGSTATAFQNIGTDKMLVVAGVTKQSDTAYQAITEISSNPDTVTNSFTLGASTATGDASRRTWAFGSRGSDVLSLVGGAIYAAPISNVITGIGNISAPASTLRVNGVQAATSSASQGTGNFGNYPLYIGRRNNASSPLNGNIYSLVIAGAAYSAGQISSTESWVAAKTPLGTI